MMQERKEYHQGEATSERYHLLRCIGLGNPGETWLAEDPRLHRQVAVKTLPPHDQHDYDYAARFGREAHAIATLNHPHILPIHDYGELSRAEGQRVSYLVMPYIEGGSLAELLTRRSLSQQEALTLLAQAAEALDYAHSQHVLHYNIKPSNMLLRSDLWLLLADCAIARIVASSFQSTAPVGTPEYLAPEQAEGQAVPASDLYSLAVVAYQLLTGHLPFQARTSEATITLHKTQPPPSPRRWNPTLPPACEEVLLRGLAKKPEERYPSAHVFVEALTHSLEAPTQAGRRITRRHLLIGTGLTVLVGMGGTWAAATGHLPFITSSTSSPPDPDAPTKILRGHSKPAHALAWLPAPGSIVLASACNEDSTVKLWNLQTFDNQQTITQSTTSKNLHRNQLALAWSPDGRSLALGGVNEQGRLQIDVYRPDLSTSMASFSLPSAQLNGLGWTKQTLLTALYTSAHDQGQRFSLGLWDTQRPTLQPHPASINSVLSPSGYESTYRSLAASLDGTRLAIGTMQGALVGTAELTGDHVLWKPASFGLLQYPPDQHTGNPIDAPTWISAAPQSGQVLLAIAKGNPYTFVGWYINGDKAYSPYNLSGWLNSAPNFTALAGYSPAQKVLYAAGTRNGEVYLWDSSQGHLPIRTLHAGTIKGSIITLAWSADGRWLAASYNDSAASIAVWSV